MWYNVPNNTYKQNRFLEVVFYKYVNREMTELDCIKHKRGDLR